MDKRHFSLKIIRKVTNGDIMIKNLKLPEELLNTPFKDWEHPSLRFDMKENESVTKHIFYYKTDKHKSFSKQTEPKTKLLEAIEVIQKLPKIKNLDNTSKENVLNEFSGLMKSLMPHLMLYTGDSSNTVKLDNDKVSIEDLNNLFKSTSKSKRKAMLG